MKVSFQIKLFISLVAFFSVLFALLGGYYYADVGKQLYQEMSTRAKIQAEEIALIPTLRHEVEQKNIIAIHDFMQKISAHSDASFIVIGDNKGQHLFHSVFADRVGTTLVGGDNEAVLQGKSTTTIRKGGAAATLKGIEFNNFGAFFSRSYRENDYLWGRLHGIDRLVDIVLSSMPGAVSAEQSEVIALKKKAFEAVLEAEALRLTRIQPLIEELRKEIEAI